MRAKTMKRNTNIEFLISIVIILTGLVTIISEIFVCYIWVKIILSL